MKKVIENVPKQNYKEYYTVPNRGYPNHYQMRLNRTYRFEEVKGKCEVCEKPAKHIHHVDKTKDNHNITNLLVVCNSCHKLLHSEGATIESVRLKKLRSEGVIAGNTSKYVRKYGMSIKDMMGKLDMSRASIHAHLQNQKRRKNLLIRLGIEESKAIK